MNTRTQKFWILIVAILTLLLVGLGCSLTSLLAFKPVAASAIVPPTATTAPPVAIPISDQTEAVNALEAQLIAVYEAVSPAVVNITNRSYVYMFRQAVPQEGSGSGFVYDTV
jgi:flagellar basal body-associated protein FliL